VTVIAVDDDNFVHLTEEFHYAVGRVTLEGVSGGIDPGETAEEAAKRELAEE
jgi:ADP-ribose pyrophosphatase